MQLVFMNRSSSGRTRVSSLNVTATKNGEKDKVARDTSKKSSNELPAVGGKD
jgi:hypothetical protein